VKVNGWSAGSILVQALCPIQCFRERQRRERIAWSWSVLWSLNRFGFRISDMDRSIFIVFQLLALLLLMLTQFVGHSAGYEDDEGEEIKTEVSVNLYDESWESR
jgi:hypothetical protein